jgi:oligosaccharide repeat unit polymerase
MFTIYIYLRSHGVHREAIKYQTIILLTLFLVIGNRSVIMGIVLSSAWYLSTRTTNLLRDATALVALFLVLVLVQSFRGAGHITGDWLEGMRITLDRFAERDIWVYLLSIQSDNFGVISYVIGRMEVEGYYYGFTYLESLVRLIPGFLRSALGIADEGEIFSHIEFLGYDGIAFSLMGEIYMNFGHLGVVLVMFYVGLLLGYLSDMADKKKGLYTIFMLNMYPVVSTLARNDSALSIKQFVYTLILVSIIILISTRGERRLQKL